MVDTVLDLLTEALTDLGVLADGETPSASQAQKALSKLNSMLDAWNLENLSVYGAVSQVFPFTAGVGTYTMGPSGTFNTGRPVKIVGAYLRNVNEPGAYRQDIPLQILTDDEYQQIQFKGQQSSYPYAIWVNYTNPQAVVTVIPAPTDTNYRLVLWTEGQFAALTQVQQFLFPPGYREAIVANLVLRLAPQYAPLQPSVITENLAASGKRRIQANNVQINALTVDPLLTRGWFDPIAGWWYNG